jgi:Transmembrane secretion effector
MRIFMDTEPLRDPDFRRLWGAGAVTALGAQLTAVAVPLQIYALTGSSAYVGLGALAGFVPMVVAALWGGVIADSADRRLVLLATNGGIWATSIMFWLQAAAGLRSVYLLLGLIAVQQALFGANAAASGAVVPRLVPAAVLPAANALQSTAMWTAGIAGPVLAGGLLPVTGSQPLYLADAVTMTATLWAVWRLPALPPAAGVRRKAGPREIAAGLSLLAGSDVLLAAYLADFAALFLGLPYALFPQLAHEWFRPADVGALYAAIPAGCVLAGLFSGTFTRIRRHGLAVTAAVCAWGAAIAAFGLTRSLPVAVCLLTLAGAALTVLSAFRKTLLQTVAADSVRGRLQGADTVIAAGGPRLAGFAHGAAAAAFGPASAVCGGGLLAITAMLALTVAYPPFRRYRAPRTVATVPT